MERNHSFRGRLNGLMAIWHPRIRLFLLLACCCGSVCGLLSAAEPQLPGPLPVFKHPRENPASPEKIALGRQLFFDPRLSRNDKIACATCHDPTRGFTSGTATAKGVDGAPGRRNVPSLYNAAFNQSHFWDGRAATLEEQALHPIENPAEMDLQREALVAKLKDIAEYREMFAAAFSEEPISAQRVAQALAAYERTIISSDTPFDRHLRGDQEALAPAAKRGLQLFYGDAGCVKCHQGPELTDHKFHNIGIGLETEDNGPKDNGRREVTKRDTDQGAYRTPSLREVAHTAPYMHDGSMESLTDVVRHYNFGGVTGENNPHRDGLLEVLYLSPDQVADLVAFLREGLSSSELPKFDSAGSAK